MFNRTFTGRKLLEFKSEVFNDHLSNRAAELNITEKDLEIVYKGKMLDEEYEVEYCTNTDQHPLIVYAPIDMDYG